MKVFEEYLLDADWSLNAGNWMWLSASAFFHQYFRVYSPISFGKKTDPSGQYIKKYLPQLEKFPEKYIFEPWTAPLVVQQKAGCIIGEDYPRPIVDHSSVSKVNMNRMKAAFEASKAATKEGNSGEPPIKKARIEKKTEKESEVENENKSGKKRKSRGSGKDEPKSKITKYFKKK